MYNMYIRKKKMYNENGTVYSNNHVIDIANPNAKDIMS